jgi:hypothetical protein
VFAGCLGAEAERRPRARRTGWWRTQAPAPGSAAPARAPHGRTFGVPLTRIDSSTDDTTEEPSETPSAARRRLPRKPRPQRRAPKGRGELREKPPRPTANHYRQTQPPLLSPSSPLSPPSPLSPLSTKTRLAYPASHSRPESQPGGHRPLRTPRTVRPPNAEHRGQLPDHGVSAASRGGDRRGRRAARDAASASGDHGGVHRRVPRCADRAEPAGHGVRRVPGPALQRRAGLGAAGRRQSYISDASVRRGRSPSPSS